MPTRTIGQANTDVVAINTLIDLTSSQTTSATSVPSRERSGRSSKKFREKKYKAKASTGKHTTKGEEVDRYPTA